MDRKHHFSSSPGSAAEWIGVKRMVLVVVVVVVGWGGSKPDVRAIERK